jgi:hypothetical protein
MRPLGDEFHPGVISCVKIKNRYRLIFKRNHLIFSTLSSAIHTPSLNLSILNPFQSLSILYINHLPTKRSMNMKQNIGSIDKLVRVLVAAVIVVLYFSHQITGTAGIILGIFAVIFLLTSAIGFCPLYLPLKISTTKKNDK